MRRSKMYLNIFCLARLQSSIFARVSVLYPALFLIVFSGFLSAQPYFSLFSRVSVLSSLIFHCFLGFPFYPALFFIVFSGFRSTQPNFSFFSRQKSHLSYLTQIGKYTAGLPRKHKTVRRLETLKYNVPKV